MMKLVMGLGNPGEEYKNNRHNVGYMMLDRMAKKLNVDLEIRKKKTIFGRGKHGKMEYLLLKPLTFMNLSGESAIYISKFFDVSVEDIFVIYDDMDLPFGTFKIKKGGSSGGHNGIKSLIAQLQSEDFFRIRIGIGRPSFGKKVNDYVLSSFSKSEREIIDNDISNKVIEAVKVALFESPIITQNRFNKRVNNE